jgi:hypothetical protein
LIIGSLEIAMQLTGLTREHGKLMLNRWHYQDKYLHETGHSFSKDAQLHDTVCYPGRPIGCDYGELMRDATNVTLRRAIVSGRCSKPVRETSSAVVFQYENRGVFHRRENDLIVFVIVALTQLN